MVIIMGGLGSGNYWLRGSLPICTADFHPAQSTLRCALLVADEATLPSSLSLSSSSPFTWSLSWA
jgi:hypothetical protein